MKKSLKIFALAASFLQAALFSAFAANPPSDFTYKLTDDNKNVIITGVRNNKAEYVIPASIEDFPVTKVNIDVSDETTITIPEGVIDVKIRGGTVNQLPSSVKKLDLSGCKYNEILPAEIEEISINAGDEYRAKLNQSLSKLQNLKRLDLSYVDFIGTANKTTLKLPKLERLRLDHVNLIDKSISINCEDSSITNTNVEEIIFEEGITKLERYHGNFNGNKNLKRIVLPSTLQSVFAEIFKDCPNLSEVVVPDSLTKVEISTRIGYQEFFLSLNGYRTVYRNANKLEDVFDTTSLSLKSRIKLQEVFGFSK